MTARRFASRRLSVAAQDTDLGEVISIHGPRHPRALMATVVVATFLAGAAAVAIAAIGLARWWVAIALACYVALLALALWLHRSSPQRPDVVRFVVAENGVLIWPAGGALTAVPWSGVRVATITEGRRQRTFLACDEVGELGQAWEVPATVADRDALLRAVRAGGPVPPRRWEWRTVAALSTALVLLAAPVMLTAVLGVRPGSVEALATVCSSGAEFGRSAPYRGAGPHPLLVFTEVDGEYGPFPDHHQGTASDDPPPTSVELVACGRLSGDLPTTPLTTCDYGPMPQPVTTTNEIRVYQGTYQVDVYEVRTGRQVTSFPLDGQEDRGCGDVAYFDRDEKSRDHYTRPSAVSYQTRLSSVVDRDVGP